MEMVIGSFLLMAIVVVFLYLDHRTRKQMRHTHK